MLSSSKWSVPFTFLTKILQSFLISSTHATPSTPLRPAIRKDPSPQKLRSQKWDKKSQRVHSPLTCTHMPNPKLRYVHQVKYTQDSNVFRNTKARSRNHCCRPETISITNSECVLVALVIQHAPYYTAICGLSVTTIFFLHYLIKRHDFRVGGKQLNTKRVFWFPLHNLSETMLIIRTERHITNVHRSSSKVPVILVAFY